MKLTRIALQHVRTVADGEHGLTHQDGRPLDIVVISGPAASGKTTMLDAIAMAIGRVAPRGRPTKPRDFLRYGESNGRVELTILLSEHEREQVGYPDPIGKITVRLSGSPSDNDPRVVQVLERAVVDVVPANRRLSEPVGMEPTPDEHAERRMRLGADDDKYRGVLLWLRRHLVGTAASVTAQLAEGGMVMAGDANDPLAPFQTTLAAMCPWLRLDGIARDGATPMFVRDKGSRAPLMELSATEQDAVLLCATAHRFWKPGAVVLIDRPDLHAAPELCNQWLATLRATFDCQLVVAVTSRQLADNVLSIKLKH